MKPDGTCIRVKPADLGVIGNAHHIKMGNPEEGTDWDTSFEGEFDRADSNFPGIISWLGRLARRFVSDRDLRNRFIPHPTNEHELRRLTESVVSLAVRSPMNREASVALAEHLRGPIPTRDRNVLIGMNMRQSQRLVTDSIGARAKFAVLFSQGREFVYGDGFFHNTKAIVNPPLAPKMLVPITPVISVVIARPSSFSVEPQLTTLVLTDAEVDGCNHAVQVYSRNAIYFRSDRPTVDESFTCGEHREYADLDNPIDSLIAAIPGVPPRDRSFDFLGRTPVRK